MSSASNSRQPFYPSGNQPHSLAEPVSSFAPTAVQIERVQALKRFNRLVIYLPLGLLVTAVLGLLVYLLILAIWPPYEDTRLFLSGIADIILILFMLPVILLFGLLLVGIVGGMIYWRQSRNGDDQPSLQKKYGRLRLLLWKLDQKLSTLYQQADRLMPAIANPVIRFNARLAALNTWLARLNGRSNRN